MSAYHPVSLATRPARAAHLKEHDATYALDHAGDERPPAAPAEAQVTALWLLGRVPAALLAPWTLLRPGRAGRGPGPDVREMACALPSGVVIAGDVEVHLRASDWLRHGHASDHAYDDVVLHLVWVDDRAEHGAPQQLPGGGLARTIAVGPLFGNDEQRLLTLLRRGPATVEPCTNATELLGREGVLARLQRAGQQRLAERTWRAARLVAEQGWNAAWATLLERALRGSAGRVREDDSVRAELARRVTTGLGREPLQALAACARSAGSPAGMIETLRGDLERPVLGTARAAEVGWNAALPLLAALAAAYEDVPLARSAAALVAAWPAPRPYGRTRALASLLATPPRDGTASGPLPPGDGRARRRGDAAALSRSGALMAQGLLHTQDLWCERGGCGVCPFSAGGQPPLTS